MKGLFYKELHGIWVYGRYYIVLLAVLYGIAALSAKQLGDNLFFLIYLPLVLSALPITSLSVDESCGWDSYYDSLPVTRPQRVAVTYGITLVLGSIGTLALLAVAYPSVSATEDATFLLALLPPAELLFPAFVLPFCFGKGGVKGASASRYFLLLAIIYALVMTYISGRNGRGVPRITGFSPWLSLALSAGLFALSWLISIKLYEKREL